MQSYYQPNLNTYCGFMEFYKTCMDVHNSKSAEVHPQGNIDIIQMKMLHWKFYIKCVNLARCCTYTRTYVSLRLRVQNRRKKWNFPLYFRTMRKLSDLYSGIFQTKSSGCASGVNYFRNFTKLKNLNF